MNKLLIIALLLMAQPAVAQIGQGRWLLAGNGMASGFYDKSEAGPTMPLSVFEQRNWSGTVSARVGYFTQANWAMGVVASYSSSGDWSRSVFLGFPGTVDQGSSNALQQSSAGFFVRRYQWLGAKQRFGLFAEASLRYFFERERRGFVRNFADTSGSISTTISSESTLRRGVTLHGAIGAVYRVNIWLGIEVLASLGSLRYNVREEESMSVYLAPTYRFSRNVEFQSSFSPSVFTEVLTVGFQFYLGGGSGQQ